MGAALLSALLGWGACCCLMNIRVVYNIAALVLLAGVYGQLVYYLQGRHLDFDGFDLGVVGPFSVTEPTLNGS